MSTAEPREYIIAKFMPTRTELAKWGFREKSERQRIAKEAHRFLQATLEEYPRITYSDEHRKRLHNDFKKVMVERWKQFIINKRGGTMVKPKPETNQKPWLRALQKLSGTTPEKFQAPLLGLDPSFYKLGRTTTRRAVFNQVKRHYLNMIVKKNKHPDAQKWKHAIDTVQVNSNGSVRYEYDGVDYDFKYDRLPPENEVVPIKRIKTGALIIHTRPRNWGGLKILEKHEIHPIIQRFLTTYHEALDAQNTLDEKLMQYKHHARHEED
ncbi:MAG: hypothetical protein V1644_00120 [Candidatus Micrarchaeota archaeon]